MAEAAQIIQHKIVDPYLSIPLNFHPILSAIRTPTYKLAKFLVPILSPLLVNEFLVHDSLSLANKVSSFCPDSLSLANKVSSFCPDYFMASLHVENLFTNIPSNEIIDICMDDLFCDTNMIHNIDHNNMRERLTLAGST